MLQDKIWSAISTRENIEDLIIMQDGDHPYFAIAFREWLNAHYPGRWMDLRGLHQRPAVT